MGNRAEMKLVVTAEAREGGGREAHILSAPTHTGSARARENGRYTTTHGLEAG